MSESNKENIDKKELWFSRIKDWQKSNLSQAAYCKHNAFNLSTFYYWHVLFRKSQRPSLSSFVAVKPIPVTKNIIPDVIQVKLPNGVAIQIPLSAEINVITKLLHALGEKNA